MFNFLGYNDLITDIPGTVIHIYSVLMAIGFLVALIASWIKLNRRNIPTRTLEWGSLVIALSGLIGARAWFVLNNTTNMENALDVVAVWRGGLAIEGGVTVGMLVGFFIFYRASKQLEISMWVFIDCIVPNILLGQAIGRWGNFFNQELLGANVGHAFTWLPSWINNHLHYGFNNSNPDPVAVYRQPLFLYESLLSLFGWCLLTFFVPKVGQMFSKKPWKLLSPQFVSPLQENPIVWKDVIMPWKVIKKFHHYHHAKQESLKKYPPQFVSPLQVNPIVWKDVIMPWKIIKKFHHYRKFKNETWKKAYFDFVPDRIINKNIVKKSWHDVKIKLEDKEKINKFKYITQPHYHPINNIFNPNNYRLTYAGVCGSLYFVFYGIIRMILEPLRDARDIMMIGNVSTSMIVSGLWIIFGSVLAVFAQSIAPTNFRKGEWLYEKAY